MSVSVRGGLMSPDDAAQLTASSASRSTSGDTPLAFATPTSTRLNEAAGPGAGLPSPGRAARDSMPATSTLMSFCLNLLTSWNYWDWKFIIRDRLRHLKHSHYRSPESRTPRQESHER